MPFQLHLSFIKTTAEKERLSHTFSLAVFSARWRDVVMSIVKSKGAALVRLQTVILALHAKTKNRVILRISD